MDTQDLRKEYEELHSLTTTKGYAVLQNLLSEKAQAIDTIRSVPDETTLRVLQGQLEVLDFVIHLREVAEALIQALEDDGNAQDV